MIPAPLYYEVGEELDLTGFALTLEMTDGTTRNFSDFSKMYIHNFYSSEKGNRYIKVEYYGYKTYFEYKVTEDPNGKCGDNLKWVFDDESGILTISGYGKMNNYSNTKPAPWYNYRNYIQAVKIDNGLESIGSNAFYKCDNIKSVNYSGTAEDWSKISCDKNQFREMELYFNGELHEHAYVNDEITREPTCRISGTLRHYCECGDCSGESIPTLPHTPGEWENDDYGETVKKCTECQRILEIKAEEIPDEEKPTDPELEESTPPETGENIDNSTDEPTEEPSVLEKIAEVFEKIADVFEGIFSFIARLFVF